MLLEASSAPYHPQGISAGRGAEELGQMWEEGLPLTHSFATKSAATVFPIYRCSKKPETPEPVFKPDIA